MDSSDYEFLKILYKINHLDDNQNKVASVFGVARYVLTEDNFRKFKKSYIISLIGLVTMMILLPLVLGGITALLFQRADYFLFGVALGIFLYFPGLLLMYYMPWVKPLRKFTDIIGKARKGEEVTKEDFNEALDSLK